MARPVNLVIPVETKVRELDAKLLFGLAAAEAGYRVVLGAQEDVLARLPALNPCVYVDKSFASTKAGHFRRLRDANSRIAAWDEEGLVYFDEETYRSFRIHPPSAALVDVVLAWGEAQGSIVRKACPPGRPRVETPGHPRIDLLRPELKSFFDADVAELKRRHGRILLVNTAFPFANHFLGDGNLESLYARYPIARERPDFFEKWRDTQARGWEVFQAALPELIRAFPGHHVVVRPHPSENWDAWRALATGLPFTVSGEGNVVKWILASEAVIHFDCLTGIEAFCAGVPAVVLRPFASPGFEQHLPNDLSHRAGSVPELIELLQRAVAGRLAPLRGDTARLELARRHLANLEGEFGFDRCVRALEGLQPGPAPAEPAVGPARRLWRAWLGLYRPLRDLFRHSAYDRQKFGGLTRAELEAGRLLFTRALGRFGRVRIHRESRRVFTLTQDNRTRP